MNQITTASAKPDIRPKICPYIDASGQIAFQVITVTDVRGRFVRRPSGEGDRSWLWNSLDAGEFMRSAPDKKSWFPFNAAEFEQYPPTRERKVFSAAPIVPYQLPDLNKAVAAGRVIYVAADEDETEFIRSFGFVATCCAEGAENWGPEHSKPLRGANVVLYNGAKLIAQKLDPIAGRLRILDFVNDNIKDLVALTAAAKDYAPKPDSNDRPKFKRDTLEEPQPERPTTADIIPFPTKRVPLGVASGPGFAAAVREACAVFAQTGRLGDAALVYGKYNIAVFPCDPVTKVPIPRRDPDPTGKYPRGIPGTGGVKKATCDPIIITQWWKKNPRALIAVAMGPLSGVWCIDVDTAVEHKDESVTAWDALLAEHEPLETREHRSASDGPHAFFQWQNELPLGCSPGQMPKGISIKGAGGYVVVPPSVRKGRSYTVFRDIDPIDAPQWLIDIILAGKSAPTRDPKNPRPLPPPFEGTPQCDLDELAEAMRFAPNDNSSREFWVNWGLAIFAASGGGQRGLEIFDEWSRKWHGYNAADTDQRWYEMTGSPPNRTGAGKIFKVARAHGWQPKLKSAPPTYAIAADTPAAARDKMHEIVRGFLFAVDNPEPWQNDSNAPRHRSHTQPASMSGSAKPKSQSKSWRDGSRTERPNRMGRLSTPHRGITSTNASSGSSLNMASIPASIVAAKPTIHNTPVRPCASTCRR